MRVVFAVVLSASLRVLFWAVFIQAILSWLPGVTNSSEWVERFERAVQELIDPVLGPIRSVLPTGGMIDFSPLVLLILIRVAIWLVGRVLLP